MKGSCLKPWGRAWRNYLEKWLHKYGRCDKEY